MLDRDISKTIALCYKFYLAHAKEDRTLVAESDLFKKVENTLRYSFLGLSMQQQGGFPGWEADKDHPGFMTRISPPGATRVPFFSVPMFPSDIALQSVWELGQDLKLAPETVICLSGSMVVLKAAIISSDLDFVEYVKVEKGTLASLPNRVRDTSARKFQKLKLGSRVWEKSDLKRRKKALKEIDEAISVIDPRDSLTSSGKLDFLVNPSALRPCDLSNILIFCDGSWNSFAKKRTHAAQEAVLDLSFSIPHDLIDPFAMGKYVDFLWNEQMRFFNDKNYTKALKRLLSLSRVCFLPKISDSIKTFFETNLGFLENEVQEIDMLLSHVNCAKFRGRETWIKKLTIARMLASAAVDAAKAAHDDPRDPRRFTKSVADKVGAEIGA
jgi:hypothetical protein